MKSLIKFSVIVVVTSILYTFLCKVPEWMIATEATKDFVILTGALPILNAIGVVISVILTIIMAACIGMLGFEDIKESKEATPSVKKLITLAVISILTIWITRTVCDNSNYIVWRYFKTLNGTLGIVAPYTIRGIWLYLIDIFETVTIIIGSIIIFKYRINESFFCEKCHLWADETIEKNLSLATVDDIEKLIENVKNGNIIQLCNLAVEKEPNEKSNLAIKIVYCKSCLSALVSVSYNKVTPAKEKGKFETDETELVNKVKCPIELFDKYYK